MWHDHAQIWISPIVGIELHVELVEGMDPPFSPGGAYRDVADADALAR